MLDFAAERDGGRSDNSWISYGMQSCNQITVTNILTLVILQVGCPSRHPTDRVKALKGYNTNQCRLTDVPFHSTLWGGSFLRRTSADASLQISGPVCSPNGSVGCVSSDE